MKKFFAITVPISVIILLAAQFSSCEKYILPEMSISEDSLHFASCADTLTIVVHSNVIWSFKNEADVWYYGYPDWGDADSTVVFSVKENTGTERQAELTIKTESISRTLHLFQEGQEQDY